MFENKLTIAPLDTTHLEDASILFAAAYGSCRLTVPDLPERWADNQIALNKLQMFIKKGSGLAAITGGRLVGYLGWYHVPDFRDSGKAAAYVPEWAHAADETIKTEVYRTLYRAAAELWHAQGVKTHALSYTAGNPWMEQFWFWNGFGLLVVDAVRTLDPLPARPVSELVIKKAGLEDTGSVLILEIEHWQHYLKAPIFMNPHGAITVEEIQPFIGTENNAYFLAEYDGKPAGMMKFEPRSSGATDLADTQTTIAVTGAYVRPEFRGLGTAPALLNFAFAYYAEQGRQYCSVDFESFNPEAAAFWMKHFEPIRYSVFRVPESSLRPS